MGTIAASGITDKGSDRVPFASRVIQSQSNSAGGLPLTSHLAQAIRTGHEPRHEDRNQSHTRPRLVTHGTVPGAIANFPPPGFYVNSTFGVILKNEGIRKCTFALKIERGYYLAPYSRMTLNKRGSKFNCYIPAGNRKVHVLGEQPRRILGLGQQEPLKPSVIRLCHSAESNRTWMELPSGSVLLSWEPLLSEENAGHGTGRQRVGLIHTEGDGLERMARGRKRPMEWAENDSRDPRLRDAEPEGLRGAHLTEAPGNALRTGRIDGSYDTEHGRDILATAVAIAGISGEDTGEGGKYNKILPGDAVHATTIDATSSDQRALPGRLRSLHPAVSSLRQPMDVPPREAVVINAATKVAGGIRDGSSGTAVRGGERQRESVNAQGSAHADEMRINKVSWEIGEEAGSSIEHWTALIDRWNAEKNGPEELGSERDHRDQPRLVNKNQVTPKAGRVDDISEKGSSIGRGADGTTYVASASSGESLSSPDLLDLFEDPIERSIRLGLFLQ
ncbi:hypothetical protein FOL46_001087 [Perkinsus olseni]|nr:hypothetical protein FOL46_001087 [Perkinsus olseni]